MILEVWLWPADLASAVNFLEMHILGPSSPHADWETLGVGLAFHQALQLILTHTLTFENHSLY